MNAKVMLVLNFIIEELVCKGLFCLGKLHLLQCQELVENGMNMTIRPCQIRFLFNGNLMDRVRSVGMYKIVE